MPCLSCLGRRPLFVWPVQPFLRIVPSLSRALRRQPRVCVTIHHETFFRFALFLLLCLCCCSAVSASLPVRVQFIAAFLPWSPSSFPVSAAAAATASSVCSASLVCHWLRLCLCSVSAAQCWLLLGMSLSCVLCSERKQRCGWPFCFLFLLLLGLARACVRAFVLAGVFSPRLRSPSLSAVRCVNCWPVMR